jgi:DNA-directed RNA polymerase specialized sigma24 family protein
MKIESLVRLAKRGDVDARDRVLSHAWDFINSFVASHIGSVVDADDITQETIVEIDGMIDSLVLFSGVCFDDWLAGIAWKRIARYRSGEYAAGRRVSPSVNNEIPMSSVFHDEDGRPLAFDEIEEYGGLSSPEINYGPEARREMEEAERAFRGN